MKMKIGTRILAGYGVALLVFGVVCAVAYHATTELVDSADWVNHTYQVKAGLSQLLAAMTDAETGQRGFILTGREEYLQPYDSASRVAEEYVQNLRQLTSDNPNQRPRLAALQNLVTSKLTVLAQAIGLRRQKGESAAVEVVMTDQGKREMEQIRQIIGEMDDEENRLLQERDQTAKATAHFATNSIVMGGTLAAVFVLVMGILVQRSIIAPLRTFMEFARRVGEGDLTQQAKIAKTDELGELSQHLDQMVVGLKEVARETGVVAENLTAATAEILASTQQQAAGTAEQAAAVQQANATMAEISQSGAQISDRAKQVAAAAAAVSSSSASGLQSVQGTNATMERIREQAEAVAENVIALSEKTQAVGEIITSVNDIAEQSHLLALNAAIQAAAAGDHGRSFSVVASEMKNLAAQSKQATVQVRSILGDIQKGINTSVMLTEEAVTRADSGQQQARVADRTIRQLSENLEESIRAFQQIVAGSSQQQIGFEQVTQAFRNIGIASQETAASTKQSEKAAANLNTLSQQLRAAVGRYRV
jgi:methyl-accepting chemotaxis protein